MSSIKPKIHGQLKGLLQYTRKFTPIPRLCKITLVKSPIKANKDVKEAVRLLNLSRPHDFMIHKNNSGIRGFINKAKFYVKVEDVPPPPGAKLTPETNPGPQIAPHLIPQPYPNFTAPKEKLSLKQKMEIKREKKQFQLENQKKKQEQYALEKKKLKEAENKNKATPPSSKLENVD